MIPVFAQGSFKGKEDVFCFFWKINPMLIFFLKAWLQDESLYPELVNWFLQWAVSLQVQHIVAQGILPKARNIENWVLEAPEQAMNSSNTVTKQTTKRSTIYPPHPRIVTNQKPSKPGSKARLSMIQWMETEPSFLSHSSRQGLVAKTPGCQWESIHFFEGNLINLLISLVNPLLECFGRTQPTI